MRNGKIATLPVEFRNELSFRMYQGEPTKTLLAWLNALPQIKDRIQREGKAESITKQNLSQWRQGGLREWSLHYELSKNASRMSEYCEQVENSADVPLLAGKMATLLAARYAALLNTWDGTPTPEFEGKLRLLRGLNRDLALLQKTLERSARQKIEDVRQNEEEDERNDEKRRKMLLRPLQARMEQVGLESIFEILADKANAKRLAEYVAKVKYDLPLHKKPGASRNPRRAACQSPRPAQRGEGQGEGSKTRPDKPCRSLSSHRGSKPVKAGQSKNSRPTTTNSASPQTPLPPDEVPSSQPSQTESTQSAIRMESETAKDAQNAENENSTFSVHDVFPSVKSAIRNPQSAIESNPVAPGQSETTDATVASGISENSSLAVQPADAGEGLPDPSQLS